MPDKPLRPRRSLPPSALPVGTKRQQVSKGRAQEAEKPGTVSHAVASLITTPISFFSLMAMIIEGIFGVVVVKSKLDAAMQFNAFCIMAFLFFVLIAAVSVLTYLRPRHLSKEMAEALEEKSAVAAEKSDAALEATQQLREILSSTGFREGITQAVKTELQRQQDAPPKRAPRRLPAKEEETP